MEIQPYTLELEEGDLVSVEIDGVDEIHTIVGRETTHQFFTTEYEFTAGAAGTYVLIVFPLHLSRWRDAIEYSIIARTE